MVSLLSVLLSMQGAVDINKLCEEMLDNRATLQAIASEFSSLPSMLPLLQLKKLMSKRWLTVILKWFLKS